MAPPTLLLGMLLSAASAGAIPVEGRLLGADGQPLSGAYLVKFSLVDEADGRGVWSESLYVAAKRGRFRSELGRERPLPPAEKVELLGLRAEAPPGTGWKISELSRAAEAPPRPMPAPAPKKAAPPKVVVPVLREARVEPPSPAPVAAAPVPVAAPPAPIAPPEPPPAPVTASALELPGTSRSAPPLIPLLIAAAAFAQAVTLLVGIGRVRDPWQRRSRVYGVKLTLGVAGAALFVCLSLAGGDALRSGFPAFGSLCCGAYAAWAGARALRVRA